MNDKMTNPKKLGPKIAIMQIATFAEFANLINLVSPQVCGFAICGTYFHMAIFEEREYTPPLNDLGYVFSSRGQTSIPLLNSCRFLSL